MNCPELNGAPEILPDPATGDCTAHHEVGSQSWQACARRLCERVRANNTRLSSAGKIS